jgi:hypothetical protein
MPRQMRDILSDYLNLCELTQADRQRLVSLAEAILAHHVNGWPEHTYADGDLEL